MQAIWRILRICGALAIVPSLAIPLCAQDALRAKSPAAVTPRDGVLLLKNGQVLTGRITWSGDHYFVNRDGLQMGVRAAEVLTSATDMDDAYRQQRDTIPKRDLGGHQELAQWSMRHGLLGYAATELTECEAIQPGNPRTAVLMRQLQSVVRIAENERAMAADPKPDAGDRAIPAKPQPTTSEKHPPSGQPKDDAGPALPAAAMETFVTTIQPLLINQCSNGGCHGGSTRSEFKLQRFDSRRSPSRVYTERNLAAVLKFIDRDNPDASPLVVAPSQPHGPAKTPIFEGRKLAYQAELAAWVRNAASAAKKTVKGKGKIANSGEASPRPASNKSSAKGHEVTPASLETDAAPAGNPHDPDVFNRRFFPEGRATPEVATGETDAASPAQPQDRLTQRANRPRPRRREQLPPAPEPRSVREDEIPPIESFEKG